MNAISYVLDSPGYRILEIVHLSISLINIFTKINFSKINLIEFTSIFVSFITSFICIFSMCFITGAHYILKWIEPSLILSFAVFPSLIKGRFSYYAKLSSFGFAAGAFAFPLDWPVTWKKPPIFNVFLMTIFGSIGFIIDHFFYNTITHIKRKYI